MIRLAAYLVEIGMFLEVEIIFYIRGHNKNAADRLFNQLKLNFHNKNLYTVDQCIEQFNKGKYVEAIRLTLGVMKDYYNFENHFYKIFDTIRKTETRHARRK